MLGSSPTYNWIFFCDPFGVRENGTYYLGKSGDRFVEQLIDELWKAVMPHVDGSLPIVTMGSSMGGHAAIYFGTKWKAKAAIAVSPHLDLRRAAEHGGRHAEVSWAVPTGKPEAPEAEIDTQRLFNDASEPRSDLAVIIQFALDDPGCTQEDVARLQKVYHRELICDVRKSGGHTSDFAPRTWWLNVAGAIVKNQRPNQDLLITWSERSEVGLTARLALRLRRLPLRIYSTARTVRKSRQRNGKT